MSAILDQTPSNRNFLSPLNFKFQIKKAPHVNFFIQKVNVPAINLNPAIFPTPFSNVPLPGEHIAYGQLDISFKVDEDLQNYLEIHNWLKALGKPETFDQYRQISEKKSWTGDGIYSDISVMILSSTHAANYEVVYIDAHPILLSGLEFNTTDPDVKYIEASASFKYNYYDISKI